MPKLTCQCGAKYRFAETAIGKKAKCKKCGTILTIEAENQGSIPIADEPGMLGDLAEAAQRARDAVAAPTHSKPGVPDDNNAAPPLVCPSCEQQLARGGKICVSCGIDAKTGRSLLTSGVGDADQMYTRATNLIAVISWIFWSGLYPIASEALGTKKPYAARAIALVTIITSIWFLIYIVADPNGMRNAKGLLLWAGEAEPTASEIYLLYGATPWGDSDTFFMRYNQIRSTRLELSNAEAIMEAHESLSPEQRFGADYSASQLITHAFLHGGLMHLAGNLLFLLVFGTRVNAFIGNTLTVVLYPILAIGAGIAHTVSVSQELPNPMLGASGAIMGLAGMYFVLFPLHKVHMAAWFRWPFWRGFQLSLKLWAMRGFWVVLFYVGFDVLFTLMEAEDGVAHWAHLGGFGIGMAIALGMLATRSVNARGCDIISAALGKAAWAIVGKPRMEPGALQRIP